MPSTATYCAKCGVMFASVEAYGAHFNPVGYCGPPTRAADVVGPRVEDDPPVQPSPARYVPHPAESMDLYGSDVRDKHIEYWRWEYAGRALQGLASAFGSDAEPGVARMLADALVREMMEHPFIEFDKEITEYDIQRTKELAGKHGWNREEE